MDAPYDIDEDIVAYYSQGGEQARLTSGDARLEYLRTSELLIRYLPPPPATVLDVGGGPGVYALSLAAQGYEVHLIDPVPLHVEQAAIASREQPSPLRSIEVGDARCLRWPAASVDAVLLLGPLYHLPERRDRSGALHEAYRVLRPGGIAFVAAISRFAATLYGLQGNLFSRPGFREIAERSLSEGARRNPTAYAHRPEELRQEVEEVGFRVEALLAVEGPAWLVPDLDEQLADPARRDHLLWTLRRMEAEPSLIGISPHMMIIARRP